MPFTQDTLRSDGLELATFGEGCFWCTEAVFDELEGVKSATSGYAGGTVKNPTYREVCYGNTGHAEVIQILFDPKVISYKELLTVFFSTHNPTTLNRQGYDAGTQYRSVIFYHSEEQKQQAEQAKLDFKSYWDDPIVTEISPFSAFYPAEDYHQEYYKLNGHEPYCQAVIDPKVAKFRKEFKDKLKK